MAVDSDRGNVCIIVTDNHFDLTDSDCPEHGRHREFEIWRGRNCGVFKRDYGIWIGTVLCIVYLALQICGLY